MDTGRNFRTELQPDLLKGQIDYSTPIIAIGSCFAERMGERLQSLAFKVNINPFGILYNPLSIAAGIEMLLSDGLIGEEDLQQGPEGLFHHWMFHGRFSAVDPKQAVELMNSSLESARKGLKESKTLLLTFGTSGLWSLRSDGSIVANCHKFPQSTFDHRLMESNEGFPVWNALIGRLINETAIEQIHLTVSPVRYLQQGFSQNSLSKSRLIELAHQLSGAFECVEYFPAYELMLDDLRDYRFFDKDMVHPSEQGIEYVWEKYANSAISNSAADTMKAVIEIKKAAMHRPINPDSEAHLVFKQNVLNTIDLLEKAQPGLELGDYRKVFE